MHLLKCACAQDLRIENPISCLLPAKMLIGSMGSALTALLILRWKSWATTVRPAICATSFKSTPELVSGNTGLLILGRTGPLSAPSHWRAPTITRNWCPTRAAGSTPKCCPGFGLNRAGSKQTRCLIRSTSWQRSLRTASATSNPAVSNRRQLLVASAAGQGVVLGVGVGDDEGGGGLLGVELVTLGHADPDRRGVEQLLDDQVLGEVRAGGVTPRVALAGLLADAELAAHALVG